MYRKDSPLIGHTRESRLAVRVYSKQQLKLLEMLRLFFLMTAQEPQHTGWNVLHLRRTHRPQGHRLRLEELFQDSPFTRGRKRESHAPSLPERWGGTNM